MTATASLAVALCALALPATADARTPQQDVDHAQTYWTTPVCAGQWNVVGDHTLASRNRGGEATGIQFTWAPEGGGTYNDANGSWDWSVARCEFTIDPHFQGSARSRR